MTRISSATAIPPATPPMPSACPTPAGPTPVPYPSPGPMATGWETTNAANRVKLQTKNGVSATQASKLTGSMGDEAGTLRGITSHKQHGKASFAAHSMDVKVEGKNAIRHIDPMMNKF